MLDILCAFFWGEDNKNTHSQKSLKGKEWPEDKNRESYRAHVCMCVYASISVYVCIFLSTKLFILLNFTSDAESVIIGIMIIMIISPYQRNISLFNGFLVY